MRAIILTIFIFAGYLVANFLAGKKEGEEGIIKSIRFRAGEFIIHLHHWLLGIFFLIIFTYFGWYNSVVYGFVIGIILQGFTYKDFYKVIYKK